MRNNIHLLRYPPISRFFLFGLLMTIFIGTSAWEVSSTPGSFVPKGEETSKIERKMQRRLKVAKLFLPKWAKQKAVDSTAFSNAALLLGLFSLIGILLLASGTFFLILEPILAILAIVFGSKALKDPELPMAERRKAKFGVIVGYTLLGVGLFLLLLFRAFATGGLH